MPVGASCAAISLCSTLAQRENLSNSNPEAILSEACRVLLEYVHETSEILNRFEFRRSNFRTGQKSQEAPARLQFRRMFNRIVSHYR
jgi:hypothetical protein